MKKTLFAALAATLAACGGDGGIDPTKVTFTYPAGSTPTSSEQFAVEDGVIAVHGAQADTLDASSADPNGSGGLVSFGENVLESASSGQLQKPVAAAMQRTAQKYVGGALGRIQPAYDPSCITVVPGRITYDNCTEPLYLPEFGLEATVTVNGSLTRTVSDAGVAVVNWGLTVRTSGSMATDYGPITFRGAGNYTGELTIDSTSIVGSSRSDTSSSASFQGTTDSEAVTYLTDYDVTYEASAGFCLSGGTIEVRRVWTKRPQGVDGDPYYADVGLLLTFGSPACGDVTVAWSQ